MLHKGVDFVKRCSKIILGDRTLAVGTRHCRVPTAKVPCPYGIFQLSKNENPKLRNR